MAGYSGTPLAKKLGIKAGARICVDNRPDDYLQLVNPLPDGASLIDDRAAKPDMIHLFTKQASELARKLKMYRRRIWTMASSGCPGPRRPPRCRPT